MSSRIVTIRQPFWNFCKWWGSLLDLCPLQRSWLQVLTSGPAAPPGNTSSRHPWQTPAAGCVTKLDDMDVTIVDGHLARRGM
ncbi:MAG: hypothetical protein PHZ02_08135 [Desulfocapsaceae bacterium]|nr:hypothetical protein [Desulfocapsaceae bacterium]